MQRWSRLSGRGDFHPSVVHGCSRTFQGTQSRKSKLPGHPDKLLTLHVPLDHPAGVRSGIILLHNDARNQGIQAWNDLKLQRHFYSTSLSNSFLCGTGGWGGPTVQIIAGKTHPGAITTAVVLLLNNMRQTLPWTPPDAPEGITLWEDESEIVRGQCLDKTVSVPQRMGEIEWPSGPKFWWSQGQTRCCAPKMAVQLTQIMGQGPVTDVAFSRGRKLAYQHHMEDGSFA